MNFLSSSQNKNKQLPVAEIILLKIIVMERAVKILEFKNQIEAILLEGLLKEKGIPHIIRSYHDSALDGLWQTQSGWGHLEANEENREEIMMIFREMSNQDFPEE